MNTRGNEPNKIVGAFGGRQQIHQLAKQEVKSLIVIIITVFLWRVGKVGSVKQGSVDQSVQCSPPPGINPYKLAAYIVRYYTQLTLPSVQKG